ncbi:MAG TPA: response regulator transcription factor [Bacteroidales bacterium]|jgi:two-component system alkaline phosphatase synthesis response regulator PhoP|nr:response regulator transcription factor [Bacteroidales bacterium]MDD4236740.1 response regulator transcription factor [Bacteroidales bacterium]HRW22195.1 response regulator transcription factor [Bacteroidales bacterium]
MNDYRILIVDDDSDILEFLSYNFEKNNFKVKTVNKSTEATETAKNFKPHLILLDVMMPEINGIELCEQLRNNEETADTLIIILTARGEDYSQIAGLESGADDYIVKPINYKVLISRVNALLRRKFMLNKQSNHNLVNQIKIGNLIIDREKYLVKNNNIIINLPRKEFELLALLVSSPGKVFTRNEIYDTIWGDTIVGDRTIDVHILKLREKLGSRHIKTIKGVGYKFSD